MKVWIVTHNDRHADPELYVYSVREKAIAFAKSRAREFDRFGDLDESNTCADWLYYATYSCEGDYLKVEEKEVL